MLDLPIAFQLALFLHRRLRIVRSLAEQLAERFEMLLAMRIVLARVVVFNQQQIEKLFSNTSHQLLGNH